MSTSAPEHQPQAAESQDDDFGGLRSWWAGLRQGRRQQLRTIGTRDPLPQTVAAGLARWGVWCPLVLVADGPRLVRRAMLSPELMMFLDARRAEEAIPA